MEKWNAYTKDEVLTDKILIRGQKVPEGLYHLVCEVLVRHIDGSYLCMRRALNKEIYGGWLEATAGGSALLGENPLQCIKRELEEETGLICDEFKEINYHIYDDYSTIFHSYICVVNCDKESIRLQEGETTEFMWLDEREFKKFVNSDKFMARQRQRYYNFLREKGYLD